MSTGGVIMAAEDMTLDKLWEIVKGIKNNTPEVLKFDLPTNQTVQGRPSLASNYSFVNVTVPDMTKYDIISISYHHDSGATSNTECQIVPIQQLRDMKTISFYWGYHYWHNSDCVLTITYVNDTTLSLRSGDGSTGGIFSPMYFMKL